ncbi:meckelin [Callorhinchus milii]|uniref:meckelin n=1 Tax=Callorhinchus milii TaxID=7868 RepID=UPI0004575DBC|nr:meckelin [Callorhinchus milii]|eukprot:gi/632969116/ref/XP_007900910.1/ PREDICTED: meckelin [Callorhinchus milii]
MATATLPALLLSLLSNLGGAGGQVSPVRFVQVSNCTERQYFDISSLWCRPCAAKGRRSSDGMSCSCLPGYRQKFSFVHSSKSCQKCPQTSPAVTQDGWNCINCPSDATINIDGKCQCSTGRILVERTINGELLKEALCEVCNSTRPSLSVPNFAGDRCVSCQEAFINVKQSCDCQKYLLVGGLCFPTDTDGLPTSVFTIINYAHGLKVASAWLGVHLRAAAKACLQFANLTACQALGNMCVMNMNSMNLATVPNDACGLYQTIHRLTGNLGIVHSAPNWRKNLPWLYYDSRHGYARILESEPFATSFHFKKSSKNMKLRFIIAKYDARGHFLNWENVVGGTLQLCPDTTSRLNTAYNFGSTYHQSCTLSVSKLLAQYAEPIFFDIFIIYNEKSGQEFLWPIPVLNLNLQYDGTLVNKDNINKNYHLIRRMFLVDTLSGRELHLENLPKVIRVATKIKISVNLVPKTLKGNIFLPLITVAYTDIELQDPASQTVPATFSVEYKMDMNEAELNVNITLGFLAGISVIYSVLKTASWKRRIGSPMIDLPTVIKFLLFYAGDLANIFFLVTVGTGLYWLVFFKGQWVVSVLLPTPYQERQFVGCIASAFGLKMLQLLHKILNQLTIDIFFIDWERPKGKILKSVQGGGDIKTAPTPVSIWRTYLIANEWNCIQTVRKHNPIFQVFAVLFVLEILGFGNLTSMDSDSSLNRTAVNIVVPSSPTLRYGVASSVWLMIGLMQITFCTLFYERFVEDKIRQFVDLCSMSNISVFILSHKCFGYYIHGRSVHGHADTDMQEMNLNLKREAENLCGQRGLLPNTDIETFQIFITNRMRQHYDKIRESLLWKNGPTRPLINSGDAFEQNVRTYNNMNKFLSSFVDHSLRDLDYIVKDKLLLERIIGLELNEPTDMSIFYNDETYSFSDVLYYGNEGTLLIFDTLFFCIVDLVSQNFVFAAIMTYIQQEFFRTIRHAVARKNLAMKTLIDERFLL